MNTTQLLISALIGGFLGIVIGTLGLSLLMTVGLCAIVGLAWGYFSADIFNKLGIK